MKYYPFLFRRTAHTAIIAAFLLASLFAGSKQVFANQRLHEARVIAVNDGDTVTLVLNGKKLRTRLVGIDAPEMGQKPWGERAKEHLRTMINRSGRTVFVETDIVEFDKYNRLLAYLWTKDRELINERMLSDGYAVLFTIQPNSRHVERFIKAQRTARQEKRGIWGPDGLKERPLDYKKKHPRL